MKRELFFLKVNSFNPVLIFSSNISQHSDTREELTALKALDKLLRKYDRRSTPTNDLGEYLGTLLLTLSLLNRLIAVKSIFIKGTNVAMGFLVTKSLRFLGINGN